MPNSLRVTELDFDQIKKNLKDYLKAQSEFTDYDFEGSGLSVLIDLLAYNTHYNAFYINMAINEMFLDSAVKRESLVSIAKLLNYTPRSARAAQAIVNLTVNGVTGSPSSLTLPRYTAFSSTVGETGFTFYNTEPITIVPISGVYSYSDIQIYEGTYVVNRFDVGADAGPAVKYEIPNADIDTTTLRVTVQSTAISTVSQTYTLFAGDITKVAADTAVYFLEQNTKGFYQIYFGDGVLGKRLFTGNRITVEYLVTNGTAANTSEKITQTFDLTGSLTGGTYTDVTVATVENSGAGQDPETTDEIRFNAPKTAASQNRLVTKYDYESFLKREFNYIDAISVWGGEENDPPQYGKVFISMVPKTGQFITTSKKKSITDTIAERRSLALTPVFVDPDIIYVNVSSTVKFNPNITNETASDISIAAVNAINTYFQNNVGSFGQYFSESKLLAAIDNTRQSILSNLTKVTLQKRLVPTLGISTSQRFTISNIIEEHTVTSTRFFYNLLGTISQAQIKDVPDAATVLLSGTFRRTGVVITAKFNTEHQLTEGEFVNLSFSSTATSGRYQITSVPDEKSFVIISVDSGTATGTVTVTSEPRGRLVLFNPTNNTTLNNNIGFVSYNSGLIQINDLNVYGFLQNQTDVRLYFNLVRLSEDISILRNQIIKLDTDSANDSTNRLAGVTVSVLSVPR